jgi:hypothetical protein
VYLGILLRSRLACFRTGTYASRSIFLAKNVSAISLPIRGPDSPVLGVSLPSAWEFFTGDEALPQVTLDHVSVLAHPALPEFFDEHRPGRNVAHVVIMASPTVHAAARTS